MTAIQVAQMIIYKAKQNNISLNNTKLQKLLYIVYGIYLVKTRKPLFKEEPLYLPYGPVFDSVYQEYKGQDIVCQKNRTFIEDRVYDLNNIIDITLENFGKFSANTLSEWSHRTDSAWGNINTDHYECWGTPLNIVDIHEEFEKIVSQNDEED